MLKQTKVKIGIFLLIGVVFISALACEKRRIKKQKEEDEKTITAYIPVKFQL